jgi:hypothetical protein
VKLTEFTVVHPVRVPGDPGNHQHVSVTKHRVELETAQLGIEVRRDGKTVLVPWSNVAQASPVVEAKGK